MLAEYIHYSLWNRYYNNPQNLVSVAISNQDFDILATIWIEYYDNSTTLYLKVVLCTLLDMISKSNPFSFLKLILSSHYSYAIRIYSFFLSETKIITLAFWIYSQNLFILLSEANNITTILIWICYQNIVISPMQNQYFNNSTLLHMLSESRNFSHMKPILS